MKKILLVLGFILFFLLIEVLTKYLPEGWVGIITLILGYLFLVGMFCWAGVWILRVGTKSIFINIVAFIQISLGILFFLWYALLLLSDVSQGRKYIITADYKCYSYFRQRHIGAYRLELPEVGFSADINEETYQRLKMDSGKPIAVEYYPRSQFVFSVKTGVKTRSESPVNPRE